MRKPDLERRLQLGEDERGIEDVGRHVGARLRALLVRELDEEREVGLPRLLEHEGAQRLEAALERLLLRDLVVVERLDRAP